MVAGRDVRVICGLVALWPHQQPAAGPVSQRGFLKCHGGNFVRPVLAETFFFFFFFLWSGICREEEDSRLCRVGQDSFLSSSSTGDDVGFIPVRYFRCRRRKRDEWLREGFLAGSPLPLCLVLLLTLREVGRLQRLNDVLDRVLSSAASNEKATKHRRRFVVRLYYSGPKV